MELFEVLTFFRKRAGLRVVDVAEKSGMSLSTLQKIFSGYVADPNYSSVQKIADAIGVSTAEIAQMQQEVPVHTVSSNAMNIAVIYDSLDSHGKYIVRLVLNEEAARMAAIENEKRIPKTDEEAIALASQRYGSIRRATVDQDQEESG